MRIIRFGFLNLLATTSQTCTQFCIWPQILA